MKKNQQLKLREKSIHSPKGLRVMLKSLKEDLEPSPEFRQKLKNLVSSLPKDSQDIMSQSELQKIGLKIHRIHKSGGLLSPMSQE